MSEPLEEAARSVFRAEASNGYSGLQLILSSLCTSIVTAFTAGWKISGYKTTVSNELTTVKSSFEFQTKAISEEFLRFKAALDDIKERLNNAEKNDLKLEKEFLNEIMKIREILAAMRGREDR